MELREFCFANQFPNGHSLIGKDSESWGQPLQLDSQQQIYSSQGNYLQFENV